MSSQLVMGGIKHLDSRLTDIEKRIHAPIYGVYWDKGSDPTLTRTHDAVGMVAAAGLGGEWVHNDFDRAEIFGEIGLATDELGNTFIRIPKIYIRKTDGPGYKTWAVSKRQYPGFYLPWCFWDFDRGRELPHVDIGKYLGSVSGGKLSSVPDVMPETVRTIVSFRTIARANNVDGLQGYQQLDVHAYDVLRTLMFIEFGTLNMQSVMRGFSDGIYTNYKPEVSETATNRIVTTSTRANAFRVGQSIAIGTAYSSNNVSVTSRQIIAIDPFGDDGLMQIVFDGDPIDITTDHEFCNRAFRTGWSSQVAASSGGFGSLSDGKYPCVYRGIESPYADLWQWVDGININERQAWVTGDPTKYTSNVFAAPYEQLTYLNHDANGYAREMGFDSRRPFAEFCVGISDANDKTFYCDYYYQTTGQGVARVGGRWVDGSYSGPSFWVFNNSSSSSNVYIGGRLVKKPL